MSVTRWPVGRVLLVDGLLTAVVGVVVVLGSTRAAEAQVPPREPLDPLGYAFMAVAAGALLLRRSRPVPVLVATVAAVSGYLIAGYPYGPVLFPMSIAMYSVAERLPLRRSLAACGLAMLAFLAANLLDSRGDSSGDSRGDGPRHGDALVWAVAAPSGFLLAPWAVGTVIRLGRESEARSRAEATRRTASEERLRIAREVHDVVGHGLAVINMQAGIALHVLEQRPEQAKVALDAIKRTSKDALEELRGTLAVFRRAEDTPGAANADTDPDADGETDAGTAAPRRPMPGLDQLGALVSAMAESGLAVDLVITGDRADVPGHVDLAAYRIVQESLTNVLRHAGPATATVRVGYHPDEVVLEVIDNGRAGAAHATGGGYSSGHSDGHGGGHGGGHGIDGMRERAVALGGTLRAGPRVEGGFRVRARLPRAESQA